MDVRTSEPFQRCDVVFDMTVAVGCADLDGVADVDALDTVDEKSRVLDLLFKGKDFLRLPRLAGNGIVKRRDDARDTRNLADLF